MEEANEEFVGKEIRVIYDILCEGIIERAIDEDWLKALTDKEALLIMDSK